MAASKQHSDIPAAPMKKRFSEEDLRRARNDYPLRGYVIETLLQFPSKEIDGVYRFLCPQCKEFTTGIHPKVNLARCFRCMRNFNAIELVMVGLNKSFVEAVKLLLESNPVVVSRPEAEVVRTLLALAQKQLPRSVPPAHPSYGG